MPGLFISLIAAPVLFTGATFFLVVPVFALAFGGPLYLAVGTPVLLWLLARRRYGAGKIALVALLANALVCGLLLALARVAGNDDIAGFALACLTLGSVFAPLWGATFGWFHNGFPDRTQERNIP